MCDSKAFLGMDGSIAESIAYQNIHISTTLQSPSPYDKVCEHPSQYSGFSTIFSWVVVSDDLHDDR
jgi:hypothetical protein